MRSATEQHGGQQLPRKQEHPQDHSRPLTLVHSSCSSSSSCVANSKGNEARGDAELQAFLPGQPIENSEARKRGDAAPGENKSEANSMT